MASSGFKVGAKILVTGCNGSGKSSLINKFAGNDRLAKVGDTVSPTQHEKLAMKLKHELEIDGNTIPIAFIDTQGFSDTAVSDRQISENIVSSVEDVDVILICHRLYRRVDGPVLKELKELARILRNGLMQHVIIVFTCGDEYMTNCKPKPVINLAKDEVKRQMNSQKDHIKQQIIEVLMSNGISQEIADKIPCCITSAEEELPTGDWVDKLWEKCENKCKGKEAVKFVSWFRRHRLEMAIGTSIGGGIGAGIGLGGATVIGTLIGTGVIPVPGVGSAVGAAVGLTAGFVVITVVGSITGASVTSGVINKKEVY